MVWFGLEGSRFKTIIEWKRLWSQRWKRLWSHKGGYRAARAAKKRREKKRRRSEITRDYLNSIHTAL